MTCQHWDVCTRENCYCLGGAHAPRSSEAGDPKSPTGLEVGQKDKEVARSRSGMHDDDWKGELAAVILVILFYFWVRSQ